MFRRKISLGGENLKPVFRSVGALLFWVLWVVLLIKFLDAACSWQNMSEKRKIFLNSCQQTQYTVQDGDTLWGIAIYAIDNQLMPESDIRQAVDDIALCNPSASNHIETNQKIIIPITNNARGVK